MKWKKSQPACYSPTSKNTAALRYGLKINVLGQATLISAQHKYKTNITYLSKTHKKNLDI